MKLIPSSAALFSLALTALADVEFIIPTSGTICKAGDVVTAVWQDSGSHPQISELVQYDLYLYAGGDSPGTYEEVATLMKGVSLARGNSVSFTIDPQVGGNDKNAYFLAMISSGLEAFVINYSGRFTLTGMTGTFPPQIAKWIASRNLSENSTFSEEMEGELRKRRVVVDPYSIPYALQAGPTRYAPLAKKPGSTIPMTAPVPQFTASLYTIATAFLPPATVLTTLTASETDPIIGMENTAAPAPHPHDLQMKRLVDR